MRPTKKLPWLTFSLIGLAVVASTIPAVGDRLVWDRAAIASGQWWRIVTGHLVHFTPSHLCFDALVVAIAGSLIESRSRRSFIVLNVATAFSIGVTVFFFCPTISQYGGLSGVACAMCGYLALLGIRTGAPARYIGFALLALLAGKIGVECATQATLVTAIPGAGFVVLPLVHAVGVACGAVKGATAS